MVKPLSMMSSTISTAFSCMSSCGSLRMVTTPEEYFSVTANQQDLVCLAASGELVSVNDPACPPEIRKALLKKS